ncbi:hypothetical protein [Sphingobium sp. Leaf26]|uniref:hypothetical protein n=1 Tax=Sphingobium sp. Leaf26 TaxID=1735693 RepID=UPI000B157469|nr:hypothetical protein [Sphingobium sp. Leaf26]
MTLAPDRYDAAERLPALERLTAIFIGIAMLLPVLLIGHAFGIRRPATPVTSAQDEASGV